MVNMSGSQSWEDTMRVQFPPDEFPSMWEVQGLHRSFAHIDPRTKLGDLVLQVDITETHADENWYTLSNEQEVSESVLRDAKRKLDVARSVHSALQTIYREIEEELEMVARSGEEIEDVDSVFMSLVFNACGNAWEKDQESAKEDDELGSEVRDMIIVTSYFLDVESDSHFKALKEPLIRP